MALWWDEAIHSHMHIQSVKSTRLFRGNRRISEISSKSMMLDLCLKTDGPTGSRGIGCPYGHFSHGGYEKRAFGWPHKEFSLHRTLLKAAKKLHMEELSFRPFPPSQARLALAGENLRPTDAREGDTLQTYL